MAQEQASLSIPMDLLKPAIEAKVHAAIMEALGGTDKVMDKLIREILEHRVEPDGTPERYGRGTPFFQWAVEKTVRDAISDAIKEHFETKKDEIAKLLRAELAKKNSKMVRDFTMGMAEGMAGFCHQYHMKILFEVPR